MFRLLQIVDILIILPMMALGLMAGLSGGGLTPAFQRIGQLMLVTPPFVSIIAVIVAEILWRVDQKSWAYVVVLLPLVWYIGLIIWLQTSTRFFTGGPR